MITVPIPEELTHFIAARGLFEGFTTSDNPGYVELWSIEDIPQLNSDIETELYAPGFLAFAGNGGGEVLAFDAAGAVYMLPLIGMGPEHAILVANSFAAFAETFDLSAE